MTNKIMPLSEKKEPVIANRKGKSFVYGYTYPAKEVEKTFKDLEEAILKLIKSKHNILLQNIKKAFKKFGGFEE